MPSESVATISASRTFPRGDASDTAGGYGLQRLLAPARATKRRRWPRGLGGDDDRGRSSTARSVRWPARFSSPAPDSAGRTSSPALGSTKVNVELKDARPAIAIKLNEILVVSQVWQPTMLIAECIPRALGARLQREIRVPVIGIGAGPECAGQVLVIYDALGITPAKPARFVRNFMSGHDGVAAALAAFVAAVRDGSFPGPEHCF